MSHQLTSVLRALQADPAMIQLAEGLIIPLIGDRYKLHNEYFYPFPPALLPIFEDNGGPVLRGILRHWFVQRDTVYVEFLIEAGMFLETGRNAKQVLADMILQMDMVKEALTPEIIAFAEAVGFDNPQAIDEFAEEFGDDPAKFHKMPIFADDLPLSYAPDLSAYKGDFPSSESLLNRAQIQKACAFEVAADYEQDWPEWLNRKSDKKIVFAKYLSNNELDKAWLTLNSRGWTIADAIIALEQLRKHEQDPVFQLMVDNWIKGWEDAKRTYLTY